MTFTANEDVFLISTWQEAEAFACGHMRTLGSSDAQLTPPGTDGGVDVVGPVVAAQVKHFASSPVGAPAVQQLIGAAANKRHGLFYALNGYTPAAVRLADEHKVCLFGYSFTGEVSALSKSALKLSANGFSLWILS